MSTDLLSYETWRSKRFDIVICDFAVIVTAVMTYREKCAICPVWENFPGNSLDGILSSKYHGKHYREITAVNCHGNVTDEGPGNSPIKCSTIRGSSAPIRYIIIERNDEECRVVESLPRLPDRVHTIPYHAIPYHTIPYITKRNRRSKLVGIDGEKQDKNTRNPVVT